MTDYSASPTTLRRLANNMRVQQDFIEVEYELFDAIADKWEKDRAEVRELRAALEQARALLAEQADVITANVWHIPPEYSARNVIMDAAVKLRELAALLSPAAPGGAA